MKSTNRIKVAYLSPALPALSETFVYEELLAVERRGVSVVPVSVRRPIAAVAGQEALASRVIHLYDKPVASLVLRGLWKLPRFHAALARAVRLLASDVAHVGVFRIAGWKLVYQFFASVKLAGILEDQGCTHLHVHFAHTPAQIAMYASALSGVPFTIMAHANDIFEAGLLMNEKAIRASRLLTISEFNVRYLQSLGIPRERIAVVRCGVSFVPKSDVSLNHFEAPEAILRIGSLGRMVEKKGFDDLLRAAALLKNQGRRISVHIAGDGPLLTVLQDLVTVMELTNEVHFDGAMAHHAVAEWMRSLDVFVLACKPDARGDMDGIPVVLMEAMSQGIPVVSTKLSGIPELVLHEVTGLLAPVNDTAELAVQIDRLISSPTLRKAIASGAMAYVTDEFGQVTNIDRLLTHFHPHLT